jgi:hypothetical protein
MKDIDISKSVMHKVALFEKQRIRVWLTGFFSLIAIFVLVSVVTIWLAARQIMEQQSLELLTLFREDPDIIREFWRDTLDVFWAEFPVRLLLVSIVALIVLIIIFIKTRKNRDIMGKKMKQLDKIKELRYK